MDTYSDYEYENDFDEDVDDEGSSAIPHTRSSIALTFLAHANNRAPSQGSFGSQSRSPVGNGGRAPDDVCVFMPPHRPMVGGGAAAAFEAARHDFYLSRHAERVGREHGDENEIDSSDEVRQDERQLIEDHDGIDDNHYVGANYQAPVQIVDMPRIPDVQYDMLRLYHVNLLQRMEETSLILNLLHRQPAEEADLEAPLSPVSTVHPRIIDRAPPSAVISPTRVVSMSSSQDAINTATLRRRSIENDTSLQDEDVQGPPKRQRRN